MQAVCDYSAAMSESEGYQPDSSHEDSDDDWDEADKNRVRRVAKDTRASGMAAGHRNVPQCM